jgi:twitching motility protein PilT
VNEPRDIHALLRVMVDRNASDLLITANNPPLLRIDGEIVPLPGAALGGSDTKRVIYGLLNEPQRERFETDHELDLGVGLDSVRYRVNIFRQRGEVSAVIRMLPWVVQSLEDLGVPAAVQGLIKRPKGLLLITGPTGHGKSTTMAAIVGQLNQEVKKHIITVEDPIEFVHENKRSVIEQREVGSDTHSFPNALRHIFRQSPDIVMIGEMRDRETIETALTMAETGHLTLATLHTNSTIESVNRVIDAFPAGQHDQIRSLLAMVLEGILCQRLVPHASGSGRVLACELLIPSDAIRNLIRQGQTAQMYSQMILERGRGNQTLNDSLSALYARQQITYAVAMSSSVKADELVRMIGAGEARAARA